jgi:DNA-3-methyladenine glycosylase I
VIRRCAWPRNPLAVAYHDREWGVPLRNDRKLFELLILEGAQAGLSWDTILAKRKNYRKAFDGFDAAKVARYGVRKKKSLLSNAGIVRNRAKIDAALANARAAAALRADGESLAAFIWGFAPEPGRAPHTLADVPAVTPESTALARGLKRRGFRFVGPTTAYALMQACGLVNDHLEGCWAR